MKQKLTESQGTAPLSGGALEQGLLVTVIVRVFSTSLGDC